MNKENKKVFVINTKELPSSPESIEEFSRLLKDSVSKSYKIPRHMLDGVDTDASTEEREKIVKNSSNLQNTVLWHRHKYEDSVKMLTEMLNNPDATNESLRYYFNTLLYYRDMCNNNSI